jgi:Putative 8-oxoguanine DNA glycosylase OGG-like protein
MSWTKAQFDEALAAYEIDLVAEGRTSGTVKTYVGDARRFVDWLSSQRGARRMVVRTGSHSPKRRSPQVDLRNFSAPASALDQLVREWTADGRPRQVGIEWPRDRWVKAFPEHRPLLRDLPHLLDRDAVRRVAGRAPESASASQEAFIATMAWGFGWVGYGPYRAAVMLATPDATARLQRVAQTVRAGGAVAAYQRLAGDCRVRGLGPAFGTKFLAFCQAPDDRPTALIHDALVSAWLTANGRPDLVSDGWSVERYEAYLDQMHRWAETLDIEPEVVEYLMFQSVANERGNQWASRP